MPLYSSVVVDYPLFLLFDVWLLETGLITYLDTPTVPQLRHQETLY